MSKILILLHVQLNIFTLLQDSWDLQHNDK